MSKTPENSADATPQTPASPPADDTDLKKNSADSEDASRGEVAIYAFGNVEGAIADNFPNTLQNILIVVAHMNPLLLGLIMGLRTLWDGIMDPIMAYISDNTKSRYGRRRPYILFGGVSRVLFLTVFIAFMPLGSQVSENTLMEAQKFTNEGIQSANRNFDSVAKAYQQLPEAEPEIREKILDMFEGKIAENWLTRILSLFTAKEDQSFLAQSQRAIQNIESNRATLEADLQARRDLVESLQAGIAAMEAPADETDLLREQSLLAKAKERLEKAEALLINSTLTPLAATAAQKQIPIS